MPSPSPSKSPSPSPTLTPTPSLVLTVTPSTTPTPTPTAIPSLTPTPTQQPSPTPTKPIGSNSFFVATNGNDSSPGTENSPWSSLQKAADSVTAGATVYAKAGTYSGFNIKRSGTPTSPITFKSYPGEKAIIDGRKSIPYTINIVGNVHDIKISDLIVQGGHEEGHQGAGIQVRDGATRVEISNNLIRDNHSFGVRTYNATDVLIDNNEITQNAAGVSVHQNAEGVIISNNRIHHQDKMIVATQGGNDDAGGGGIAFIRSKGKVIAKNNTLWGNRAVSPDYGMDGGAFEVFGASGVEILNNTMWDNENILETGTDTSLTDPDVLGCTNNIFAGNVAYDPNPDTRTLGMLLRCNVNMLIEKNTLIGTQWWLFAIVLDSAKYNGAVDGLKIINNILVQPSKDYIYAIDKIPSATLDTMTIDGNLVYNPAGYIAKVNSLGSTKDFETFKSWTGFETNGINKDPLFINPGIHDYRLQPNSPAKGKGAFAN